MAEISDLLGRTQTIKGDIDEISSLLKGLLSGGVGKPSIMGSDRSKKETEGDKERNEHLEDERHTDRYAAPHKIEVEESARADAGDPQCADRRSTHG